MMGFQIVILWSDVLIWLLVAAGIGFGVLIAENPPLLAAWRRVGANRVGMASATVLLAFIADRPARFAALPGATGRQAGAEGAATPSRCCRCSMLAAPLRLRNEKTYSEPVCHPPLRQGNDRVPGRETVRDYPRLKHGGKSTSASARTRWRPTPPSPAFRAVALADRARLAGAGGRRRRRVVPSGGHGSCGRRLGMAENLARRNQPSPGTPS
jgi:peptide/nickel transport system permease protein